MASDLPAVLDDLPQILEDIAWVRALRRLLIVTTAGIKTIQFSIDGENAIIDLRDITPTGTTAPTEIPSQTGNSGKVLTTDGSTTSWV